MSPEAFNDISTPRCDAAARKSSATPTIYTQWMPVDDGRRLERENVLMERALKFFLFHGKDYCGTAYETLETLAEMRKEKT